MRSRCRGGGSWVRQAAVQRSVAAWSERVRFAARRGGYHGGASPQEVLIPVAVLSAGSAPPGWTGAPPAEPAWWRGTNENVAQPSVFATVSLPPPPQRRRANPRQADLFVGETPTEGPQRPQVRAETEFAWLDALFTSETYSAQRRLAGRVAPPNELVRSLLIALVARGGRMTRTGSVWPRRWQCQRFGLAGWSAQRGGC